MPEPEGFVEVETVTVSGLTSTTRRIESDVCPVVMALRVNEVPEVHVPVTFGVVPVSMPGAAPIVIL